MAGQNENTLEQRLKEQSTHPRVTQEDVEAAIASEHFFNAADGAAGYCLGAPPKELFLLTFCVLVLKNGFMCVGKSAAASPENFKEEFGREIARRNAISEAWGHMGFLLRTRLEEREKLLVRAPIPASDPGATTYVGTKVVHARPATRAQYNELRGWTPPKGEDQDVPGYVVEYADSGVDQSKVDSLEDPLQAVHQGYVTWSPKDVFERAYSPLVPVTGAL
jgi:hypothetical protein